MIKGPMRDGKARAEIANLTNNGQVTKRIFLTQAEYDALAVKDPKTEYNIIETGV